MTYVDASKLATVIHEKYSFAIQGSSHSTGEIWSGMVHFNNYHQSCKAKYREVHVIVEGLFNYFFAGLFTVRVAMEENLRGLHCGPIRWDM